MITQRFRPIMWVAGAAFGATSLYLVSLQVASEHKRLETLNQQIRATQHDIRQLQTEISTRANLRQLEKWNGESLALETPRAVQYLPDGTALDHFDVAKLDGSGDAPTAAMAAVTSDGKEPSLDLAVAKTKAGVAAQSTQLAAAKPVKSQAHQLKATAAQTALNTAHHTAKAVRFAMLEDVIGQLSERKSKP